MNNLPRRSPRFQQQSQSTQSSASSIPSFGPSFSQSSSITSSSHPSPTSDNLSLPTQTQHYPLQIQSQFLAPGQDLNVPLPSPSANDIDPFGRWQNQYNNYNMGGQTQNQNNSRSYTSENQQSQAFNSQQSHAQHHNSFSQSQKPDYPPTSQNGMPPGLPQDFLAEAAKRAQMACLMRDLGDVAL